MPSRDNAYRPHLLRKPWLLFFLTVVLTSEALYVATLMTGESAKNFLSAVLSGEVVALTNIERANAGDQALTENTELALAAQNKANDMAAKGYFSHNGPDGKEPWAWIREAGYSYRFAGENLAVRFDDSSSVVNAWMASPTHRANIVKPVYTEIGIGVAQGMYEGAPATFVVQYFGTPLSQETVAAAVQPKETEVLPPPGSSAEVAGAAVEEKEITPTASATAPQVSTPAPVPQASTQEESSLREVAQTFFRASEASNNSINWILGGIATLMILLVGLAVFVHLEIQPGELVMGGAFVGLVAFSLFMLNNSISEAGQGGQSASVIQAGVPIRTVLVGESAYATEETGG